MSNCIQPYYVIHVHCHKCLYFLSFLGQLLTHTYFTAYHLLLYIHLHVKLHTYHYKVQTRTALFYNIYLLLKSINIKLTYADSPGMGHCPLYCLLPELASTGSLLSFSASLDPFCRGIRSSAFSPLGPSDCTHVQKC